METVNLSDDTMNRLAKAIANELRTLLPAIGPVPEKTETEKLTEGMEESMNKFLSLPSVIPVKHILSKCIFEKGKRIESAIHRTNKAMG